MPLGKIIPQCPRSWHHELDSYVTCDCLKEACALWIKSRGECADHVLAIAAIHPLVQSTDPRD